MFKKTLYRIIDRVVNWSDNKTLVFIMIPAFLCIIGGYPWFGVTMLMTYSFGIGTATFFRVRDVYKTDEMIKKEEREEKIKKLLR